MPDSRQSLTSYLVLLTYYALLAARFTPAADAIDCILTNLPVFQIDLIDRERGPKE